MASSDFELNLHCDGQNTSEVSTLAHNLVDNGAYAHADVFPDIKPEKDKFVDQLGKLDTLEEQTKDSHSAVPLRNDQRTLVYDDIKGIFYYVKPICGNNAELMGFSGFPHNLLPEKSPIPDEPIILRVVRGIEPNTYKAFILRKRSKPGTKKVAYKRKIRITYTIELSLTPDIESSWAVVQEGMPSTKLVFGKYTPMVKNYIRIYGRTPTGRGQASAVFSFIPE